MLKTKVIGIVVIALVFSIGIGIMFYFMESKSVIDSSELPPFEYEGFNIAVVGDIGTTLNSARTLRNIALADPEVILFAGDLGYTSAEKWFDFSDFLGKERIHIAIGNHEKDEEEEYLRHYGVENEFYSFNYENVHFVALSTETAYSQDSEQFNFLENDLSSASVDPDIDWIIVWLHRPMYFGLIGARGPLLDFRNSMQPLFDKYDVDLVFQGHRHSYERNKPLKFNNTITDNATHAYIDPPGQIYVTVGTGGHSHDRLLRHNLWHNYEWSIIQNEEDFGFLDIKLTANGKLIQAKFKTNSGEIRDFFQICLPGKDLTGVDISRIDLSGKDLRCANLAGVDLSGKDLTGTILTGANLANANLNGVDLSGRDLTGTILAGVDLSGRDLTGTILAGANLAHANLNGVDLSGRDLTGTILVGTNLARANLNGVDLSGRDLTGTILVGVDLSGRDLTGTILVGTNLAHANLNGVDLSGNDLTGTILVGTNLARANLNGVDLSGNDLTGTILVGTNLARANLNGVDLSGRDLTGVNLAGVDLAGKNLTGTILAGANISILDEEDYSKKGVTVTIVRANLARAIFTEVDLSGSDLTGTILVGTNLAHANLNGVDLSGNDLTGTILVGTNLAHANLTGVDLSGNDLIGVNLVGANLTNANLQGAFLINANLQKADFSNAKLFGARLDNTNLQDALGEPFIGCKGHPLCT